MKLLFQITLVIHILSGFCGLILGTINIIQKKGGKQHRQIGRLFVFFMVSTGISSFILVLIHPNVFRFVLGLLTVYLVGTGDCYMRLRLLGKGQKPAFIDLVFDHRNAAMWVLFYRKRELLDLSFRTIGNNNVGFWLYRSD